MQTLTLEQLRTTTNAGGIAGVTLKAQASGFLVQITTRNGDDAVLTKARSSEPRCFGNPVQALSLLRTLGIVVGAFDMSQWHPEQKPTARTRPDRADALKRTHEAAAYDAWFRTQVQSSIDDPRPNLDGEEVSREFAERREALRRQIQEPSS